MTAHSSIDPEDTFAVRAEIRRAWHELFLEYADRWPAGRAPTAKDIARRLPFTLQPSTLYWHMEAIRHGAEVESWNVSNSSAERGTV